MAADLGKIKLGKDIRDAFPIFKQAQAAGKELHYLDSAASAQKPQCVISRLNDYLSSEHANIHRGAYLLSAKATDNFDAAREKVRKFIDAPGTRGVIFTRGTTESVNLAAHSLERWFNPGDSILLSILEHHSNIVPWQLLAERKGLKLGFADCFDDASFSFDDFREKLKALKPRLVSIAHIANSFGTVLPIAEIVAESHAAGAKVLVDAAQSSPHRPLSMKKLECDMMAFSGHKIYGPTGVGVLACTEEMLSSMDPFMGGGDMINFVTVEGSTWAEPPQKFEAGTPAVAEVIALAETIDFLSAIGMERIAEHETSLFPPAMEALRREEGVTVYGPALSGKEQSSIISFNISGIHPHDLSSIADSKNVQIRSGHHCAMPAMKRMGLPSSARASLGMYSCMEDFEALIDAVRKAKRIFS